MFHFVRSLRAEKLRFRGTNHQAVRQPEPAPVAPAPVAPAPVPDPTDPAVREYLSSLAAMMRLMADLGFSAEQARRGLAAGHRAGLRAMAEVDPLLALRVADGVRFDVAAALAILDAK